MIRHFRKLIVLFIKIEGWIVKSDVFYYTVRVQKRIFDRHKLTTNAAAISFFFLLSIIPMLFIVASILGSFVDSPGEAERYIMSFISTRVPGSAQEFIRELVVKNDVVGNITKVLQNKGWISIVSVLSLLWTSSGAFAAVEDAMSTIFGVRARNYFVSRLVEMGMVLIVGSLFLMSSMVTAIIQTLKKSKTVVAGVDFANLPSLWSFITGVLPYLLTIAMFYIIYKILPKTQIHQRAALLGAIVAGLLLEGTIFGFAYYVNNFSKYNAFYGSVAGVIIAIFTIYLASIILLIGAEVTEIANTKLENELEMRHTLKEFE